MEACHCSRCRKTSDTAFGAALIYTPAEVFVGFMAPWEQILDEAEQFPGAPTYQRE